MKRFCLFATALLSLLPAGALAQSQDRSGEDYAISAGEQIARQAEKERQERVITSNGAEGWVLSALAKDGSLFFINPSRIKPTSNGNITSWLKVVLRTEAPLDERSRGSARFKEALFQSEISCSNETGRLLFHAFYDADGKPMLSGNDTTQHEPVAPGSIGETNLRAACMHAKAAADAQ